MYKKLSWFVWDNWVRCPWAPSEGQAWECFQAGGTGRESDTLPRDIFSGALLDVDSSDPQSVSLFMHEFGVLRNPVRYAPELATEADMPGIRQTDMGLDEIGSRLSVTPNRMRAANFVSMEEAQQAVARLQAIAYTVLQLSIDMSEKGSASLDDDDLDNLTVLELARTPEFVLDYVALYEARQGEKAPLKHMEKHITLNGRTTIDAFVLEHAQEIPYEAVRGKEPFSPIKDANLTHAICNQMGAYLADAASARRCAKCGRIFKRRVDTPEGKARKGSRFCSERCGGNSRKNRFDKAHRESQKAKTAGKTAFGTEQTETGERKEV